MLRIAAPAPALLASLLVLTLVVSLTLTGCSASEDIASDGSSTQVIVEGNDPGPDAAGQQPVGLEAALPGQQQAVDPKVAELAARVERIRRLARFAGQLEAAQRYADQPSAPDLEVQQAMDAGAAAQEKLRLRQIELFLMEQEAQLRNINRGWHDLTPAQRRSTDSTDAAPAQQPAAE